MLAALSNQNNSYSKDFSLSKVLTKKSKLLSQEKGDEVLAFISKHTDVDKDSTILLKVANLFSIKSLNDDCFNSIINLNLINDIKGIDEFFREVNSKLPNNGIFVGCAETQVERKKRLFNKFPFYIAPFYFFLDFILKRVFPKLPITRKIYFLITAGRNRVLSKAEVLGRLSFCGFEIINESEINNILYFVGSKIKEHKECLIKRPSFGFIFKMERVGKSHNPLMVYKIRTMHPYAEFLQDYILKTNQLQSGGKFNDDYRITSWGKILRRFWIDELPMLYNFVKGELKIVGVRPISKHYLSLYPDELKQKRSTVKPGLIPPFYADMPKSLNEIFKSEYQYLYLYDMHPLKTDAIYFFKAIKNIIFNAERSN